MYAIRSSGCSGSIGTYAPPAASTAWIRDDHLDGTAHRHRNRRFRPDTHTRSGAARDPLTRSSNSAYVSVEPSNSTIATASGCRRTCARTDQEQSTCSDAGAQYRSTCLDIQRPARSSRRASRRHRPPPAGLRRRRRATSHETLGDRHNGRLVEQVRRVRQQRRAYPPIVAVSVRHGHLQIELRELQIGLDRRQRQVPAARTPTAQSSGTTTSPGTTDATPSTEPDSSTSTKRSNGTSACPNAPRSTSATRDSSSVERLTRRRLGSATPTC